MEELVAQLISNSYNIKVNNNLIATKMINQSTGFNYRNKLLQENLPEICL